MTHVLCQHYNWSIIEVIYTTGLAVMLVNILFLIGYISDIANNQYEVGVLSVRAQKILWQFQLSPKSLHT